MKKIILTFSTFSFLIHTHYAQTDSIPADTSKSKEDEFQVPVYSITSDESDAESNSQDVASLLQASRDVYLSYGSFHLASVNFRLRGLPSDQGLVMINGINMANPELGYASWSNWGGLNDVMRFPEIRIGVTPSRYAFSPSSGYTYIDSRASLFKKGTRVSYANSNRIFQHRVMLTHSTGMMQNGWAITVSASARLSDTSYYRGTYFNSTSYYLGVEKKINDQHSLALTAFYAGIERARKGMATKEVYNLVGDNFYNPYWGYQNGKVRNGYITNNAYPTVILTYIYNISENTKWTTSASYSYGKNKATGVTWYDAANPNPTYYKYLPSYYQYTNPAYAQILTQLWQTDVNTQQLKWDDFYQANYGNLFTVQDVNGVPGQTYEGKRSKYILQAQHTDSKIANLSSFFNTRQGKFFISGGINFGYNILHHYKTVDDLLGGDFWLDYDIFARGLTTDPLYYQNDREHPNKLIRKGDVFGYDYNMVIKRGESWGQVEYNMNKVDVYAALSVSYSDIYREGLMQNGKFPSDSKGKSALKSFVNYGIKSGATYKINGKNYVSVNAMYQTKPTDFQNIFVSPQTRNDYINPIQNEEILATDVNYFANFGFLKARATYYFYQFKNSTYLRSYFHDLYNTIVNYVMTGVNTQHQGIELGVEAKFLRGFTATGVLGIGEFIYTNRPLAQAWRNNSGEQLFSDRTVYLKNYKIGGTPQTVAGLGLRYNSKKYWYIGIYFNYFADMYIEPNPDRRTEVAISKYVPTDPQWKQLLDQEKLPSKYTIDANVGKSFRIMKKYFLGINASVSNLLNDKTIISNGIEQLRYDANDPLKFPNKYNYAMGLTYMLMINFNF
ncbi:MAG: TonB-dependent receptor [Bacteroidia bacterium]|nr:MAG: TonB-dependent receptor [Bacteroidia bacterium]